MRAIRIVLTLVVLIASPGCAARPAAPSPAAPAAPAATSASTAGQPAAPALSPSPTVVPPGPTTAPPSPTTLPATSTPAPQPFAPALAAQLQALLDRLVADGAIPGAVLSVQLPGHQAWSGASGLADRQQGLPMTPQTLVRVASISKIFTAVVVLQLVEEGRLQLDQPIAAWLPDLLPQGDQTRVRDLLQHTSGLYDFLEDRNFLNQAYSDPQRAFAPAELVDYATQFPLAFSPGAPGSWDYSSTNYVVLGMLVEQVTGKSLAQEMRRRIFEPLALNQTFFVPDEELPSTQARGYGGMADQTALAMSFGYATANLVSTVDDIRRFISALFAGQLLRPASLAMMQEFVNGHGQYRMPALEYGLGIMRTVLPVGAAPNGQPRTPAASTVMGHIGGFGGFRSAAWFAPESGIVISLGMNQAQTDPNILATQVLHTILTQLGQ